MRGSGLRGNLFVPGVGTDAAGAGEGVVQTTGGEVDIEKWCGDILGQPCGVDRERFIARVPDSFENHEIVVGRDLQIAGHRRVDRGA